MATTAHQHAQAPVRRGRYRLRTWLRGHTPERLLALGLFAKPVGPCGAHEWYRSTATTDRCYHCKAGERPAQPLSGEGNPTQIAALERAAEAGVDVARRELERLRARA
jgi:hypothetical protein